MVKRLRHSVLTNVQALRQPGSFVQNLAVTFSGAAAVAAIGFILTPIMSRIYPPASYGQFAVFNSVVGNLNLLTTLGYPGAMLLPRHRKEFLALVNFIILLTLAAVLVLTGLLLFAAEPLRRLLHLEGVGGWLYTIPLLLLLFNLNAVMFTWYTRDKSFSKRAGVDVVTTLAGRGFTIGYGLWSSGSVTGLVLGEFFNRITAFVSLLYGGIWRNVGELWHNFSWSDMKAAAKEYSNFPLYFLPANYVGALSVQLPIFALTTGFGSTVVGLYSFSVSLLELPVNLIGNAIAPVFLQKATETHNEQPERLPTITLELYYKLFYLGLIPFGIITVYGDWIFRLVFGARWEMAGLFTSFLGYYYIFKLTSHATGGIYAILGRQRYLLLSSILLLAVRAVGMSIGLLAKDLNLALLLFGIGSLLVSFLTDLHILYLLKLPVFKVALRTIIVTLITIVILVGLRLALQSMFGWPAPNLHLR
ncbi:lipopolysaccharide biosynthesis protein [Hymenobacter sp. CRA2]|uniref:lipopolysaccharide biosynthesis protein n=1 Tax=Hymenobacter sp. CRA2 TaxID=1955620 RepID=UPI0009CEE2E6|nr:oligosaccharide flippase family protein [Hymenobacter sp. CRA2]OON65923.1 hypothetical protein B0919_23145 [Hymenobacter sp. CRA2]